MVVHKDVAKVHVSGHAPAGELLYLLNAVKPRNFMPVHGEWRHLRAHAAAGRASPACRPTGSCCARTATWSTWSTASRQRRRPRRAAGYVYVDGLAVGDVGESLLTERRILGDGGFIAITVVVDSVTGKVVGGPTVSGQGLLRGPGRVRPGAAAGRPRRWTGPPPTASPTRTSCSRSVRRIVGRWVNDSYRRRPMIVPTVVEV